MNQAFHNFLSYIIPNFDARKQIYKISDKIYYSTDGALNYAPWVGKTLELYNKTGWIYQDDFMGTAKTDAHGNL